MLIAVQSIAPDPWLDVRTERRDVRHMRSPGGLARRQLRQAKDPHGAGLCTVDHQLSPDRTRALPAEPTAQLFRVSWLHASHLLRTTGALVTCYLSTLKLSHHENTLLAQVTWSIAT